MVERIVELKHIQDWCVEQIRTMQNRIQILEEKLRERHSSESQIQKSHSQLISANTDFSFAKTPDKSFLGLSKSKAYCTIIPKSSVDQEALLNELGISRTKKQTSVVLLDPDNNREYRAQVRCAFQDRSKTRKLQPEDINVDIRVLLEFKMFKNTCKWFCKTLARSIEMIEENNKSSEKVLFDYVGEKTFVVRFER